MRAQQCTGIGLVVLEVVFHPVVTQVSDCMYTIWHSSSPHQPSTKFKKTSNALTFLLREFLHQSFSVGARDIVRNSVEFALLGSNFLFKPQVKHPGSKYTGFCVLVLQGF